MHTLSRPTHLLRLINTWLRRAEPKPNRAASVPALDVFARRYFGQIVLRRTGVVHLLRRDVVDGCARGYVYDIGGIAGLVAAYVTRGRVLDALFRVGIFGLACCGPVFFFGLAVHDEAGKGICGW